MSTLAFFDQLNGVNYSTLSSTSFQIGIVDPDSSGLTSTQLSSLEASGKTMIGYLSIGEAENFRSYWESSWTTNPPSWLMGQDPSWAGDYYVQYWNPAWQQIVINEATTMAKEGYNGIMLDVVDAYTIASVAAAAGGTAAAITDMQNFVEAISAATKAINPNFKIIQNNALQLLTVDPNDASSATNTAYLSHIDGVVAESTFYNGNSPASWTSGNVQYLEHAVSAGKDVLSIEYPTSAANQQSAISQAIADGFVPFIGTTDLNSIPSINSTIPAELPANALTELTGNTAVAGGSGSGSSGSGSTGSTGSGSTGSGSTGSTGSGSTGSSGSGSTGSTGSGSTGSTGSGSTGTTAYNVDNVPNGTHTVLGTTVNEEFTFGAGFQGNTTIKYFGADVGDIIDLSPSLYSTAAQALSHVTYSGSNAIVHLPGASTITIVGAGAHSLVAADFHIG